MSIESFVACYKIKALRVISLLKDYPFLANDTVWDDIFAVVVETFKDETYGLDR